MSNIKKCLRILCKNYSTCDKNPCECDKFNGLDPCDACMDKSRRRLCKDKGSRGYVDCLFV